MYRFNGLVAALAVVGASTFGLAVASHPDGASAQQKQKVETRRPPSPPPRGVPRDRFYYPPQSPPPGNYYSPPPSTQAPMQRVPQPAPLAEPPINR